MLQVIALTIVITILATLGAVAGAWLHSTSYPPEMAGPIIMGSVYIAPALAPIIAMPITHIMLRQKRRIEDANKRLLGLNEKLQYERAEAQRLMRLDSMTELLARNYFVDEVSLALKEKDDHGSGLLMLDADGFKAINDTYGHDAGDGVISTIAESLRKLAGKDHIAGRLGGEEFAIYLRNTPPSEICEIAERMRQSLEDIQFYSSMDERFHCTVSIGVALKEEGDTAEALLKAADIRLYAAKHRGRNIVVTPKDPLDELQKKLNAA